MKGKKAAIIAGVGAGLGGLALILLSMRKTEAAEPPEEPEEGMAKLYGRVTDSQTGNGIPGARITTTGAITETDSAGDYATIDIPPGDWGVRCEKDGYVTWEQTVSTQEGNNELNIQLVPIGGEEPPGEGVQISAVVINPTQLTGERHEYETSLGLGFWGDPFTIAITFSNPFDYDVWVKPDFAFGHLNGELLEFVEEGTVLHGFDAETLLYFRLLLQSAYIEGDYSYDTSWQKPWDARGQNTGSNMAFVYDPDGVPRVGDERWVKVPAGGAITMVKDAHLGADLSITAMRCTTCGEIVTGGVEAHYEENHPGIEVTCWSWGGWGGCYIDSTGESAADQVYMTNPDIVGMHDLCAVALRALHFVYDPGCGQTRVGGQIVILNWRLEELAPVIAVVPDAIELVPD
ncbi:carboxypeptidase-like regulatory domain-containing protein [Patescibacteria group bacterium]|nr:carboxypeptidase-like regulatory domain-containing protein [Patescibacteria group bacterium]